MITESDIEKSIEKLESGTLNAGDLIDPDFLSYLQTDTLSNLNQPEKNILLFCVSLIFYTCDNLQLHTKLDMNYYLECEENNWSITDKSKNFDTLKDEMFKDYKEEDLLAFVEDMLSDDEDLGIAGKEIIFVTCKSLIDSMC